MINIYVHCLIYSKVGTFIVFIFQMRRWSHKEITCQLSQIKDMDRFVCFFKSVCVHTYSANAGLAVVKMGGSWGLGSAWGLGEGSRREVFVSGDRESASQTGI